MKYKISEIQKILSPNPFCLLTTSKPDGTTNAMALSWWTFVSNNPATVAVCLSNKGLSGELIKNTGEFGLNVVDQSLKEKAFGCGTCSGRKADKIREFDIALTDAQVISTKLIGAHKAALECKLITTLAVRDHTIYIAEVVETHCHKERAQLYAFDGYGRLDTI